MSARPDRERSERFAQLRRVLRGVFGVLLAAAAVGALYSLGSDPLGALVAGVLFALAAALMFRRTRTRVLDHVDRDVGHVSLGVALIVLLAVAGAAAPGTSGSDGADAQPAAETPAADAAAATTTTTTTATGGDTTATDTATATDTTTETATPTATDTPTATATPTPTATPTATPASQPDIQVRVVYSGEWTGAISAAGSTRSIQDSGETTIDVTDDATTVSVNAQKQVEGSEELTVQILEDGDVVKEASTTADYGVAQVAHSFGFF